MNKAIKYSDQLSTRNDPLDSSPNNTLPEVGYLRLPQVLDIFPVGRSTWYAGIKAGKYPKPHKLGERISAWHVEDIRSLIDGGLNVK